MAHSNGAPRAKHGRRRSLTQFIPKTNVTYNPYQATSTTSTTNHTNTKPAISLSLSENPAQLPSAPVTSAFSPRLYNPSTFTSTFSPRSRPHIGPFGNSGKQIKKPLYNIKRTASYDPFDTHNAAPSKPDFHVKWQPNKHHTALDKVGTMQVPTTANHNGYHTAPEYDENESQTDNESQTSEMLSYDALKRSIDIASAQNGGYLSDGATLKKKVKSPTKRKIKSYKRNMTHNHQKNTTSTTSIGKPKRIVTHITDEESTKRVIHDSVNKFKNRRTNHRHTKKRSTVEEALAKRHSVGGTDSATLGMLKTRYSNKKHSTKRVKMHRATMLGQGGDATKKADTPFGRGKRRLSIFKNKIGAPTPLDTDHATFEELNSQKWNIEQLVNVESEQEFYATLISHDKDDIIELCWDLLRSKDKSDELLRMVSIMNAHLDQGEAYDTMMETIHATLDCKFASLFAAEEESQYLKCLWTTDGEPSKDIFIAITSSTQLAARVWQKNQSLLRSLTSNNSEICPDFCGFGNVYVMGIPIRDYSANDAKIGVLMVYRDRSKSCAFNDETLNVARMLTSICSTTLRNVSLFHAANEKEKRTQKILSMIDEMSGDVSQGYQNIIKKLVRKIRSLVACNDIDFWTVDFARNKMRCEVSANSALSDMVIERDASHILGQCALSGKYVKIDNAPMDTRYNSAQLTFCRGESILVMPVRVESELEPIAVIVAINKVPKFKRSHHKVTCIPFTHADRRMLESFATSASIIVKNSLLFQKINGLNRKHESMVSILKALQEKHNVTHMLSEATLAVRDALEAERVSLWFEDGAGNLDAMDIGDVEVDDSPIQAVLMAIARHCAEDKILINTPNVFEDEQLFNQITDYIDISEMSEDWLLMNRRSCCVLCVPILSNESVVGVIQAIYKMTDVSFTDTDQQIVESVSSEIAHTIARNISDLTLAKYVDKHDDIPLDVIEYYLTGSMMTNNNNQQQIQQPPQAADEFIVANFKQQQQMKHPNHTHNPVHSVVLHRADIGNIYSQFVLDDKLKSYCDLLPTCDFDATQFDIQADLESFVMFALDEYGLIKHFELDVSKLQKFIHSIAKLYRSNPFHNWQHGFFVFHFVLYFLKKQSDICTILSRKEVLAILIAAMCHDVDHPGNDNLYEIEADSDLARIYNGLSVLENHHTYTTLALLRKSELNFLEGSTICNPKDVKYVKQIITKSIMSTDMSHHAQAIGWLNDFVSDHVIQKLNDSVSDDTALNKMKQNEFKLKICQCIVHMGDLSAQTYPWRIAKEWERRIAKEFKQQTMKEEKLSIPVRDWMANTDLSVRYKNQFFFVTHVVKPLWEPAATLFPEMEERLVTLKANSQKYIQIAKKKEK